MSEVKWSKQQQAVIDVRGKNLLVSAAAGSGKTAVLVERIKKLITEKDSLGNRVDIDRMLVLTFTNAAAAEMRDRVGKALAELIESGKADNHILKQYTLVHHAQITTIDSFCMWLVKNYFEMAEIEPGFRIADEGEMKLLKKDVVEAVLERFYEEGDPDFIDFADQYASSKNDDALASKIIDFYDKALSFPDPIKWMEKTGLGTDIVTGEDWNKATFPGEKASWLGLVRQDAMETINLAIALANQGLEFARDNEMLPRVDYYANIVEILEDLIKKSDYASFQEAVTSLSLPSFPRKKQGDDPEIHERCKSYKDTISDLIKKSLQPAFAQSIEKIESDTREINRKARVLAKLSMAMYELMEIEKKKGNMYDFSDIEHKALKVLVDADGNPTEVALELREKYYEIMTDEYQDSNFLQEEILGVLSNGHNRFMVGDVKQSIYGFRQGKPELFLEKYRQYKGYDPQLGTLPQDDSIRINLATNYRSRMEVLDSVNDIFFDTMHASVGGVEYDAEAQLNPRPEVPAKEGDRYKTELIVANRELANEMDIFSKKEELEAMLIANRIKSLHDKEGYEYRDIVILMRSVKWGEDVRRLLDSQGIPSHMVSTTGYFDNYEVQLILSLLKVIDNPCQDIPLAAIMHSVLGGFTDEELAHIRKSSDDLYLFRALKKYAECGKNEETKNKAIVFLHFIYDYREKMKHNSVSEMIRILLDDGTFINYITATPSGMVRKANINALLEKAIAFEKTSYRGVFSFVRYIEALRDYDVDFGDSDLSDENDNLVRIMTIHKSKGLQFPVVFVSGCGREASSKDASASVVVDDTYGIGFDNIDAKRRVKNKTLFKKFISDKISSDGIAEEERVLYVAMTRAESKLILTGLYRNEKQQMGYISKSEQLALGVPYTASEIKSFGTYMDMIYPSAQANPNDFIVYDVPEDDLTSVSAVEKHEKTRNAQAIIKAAGACDSDIYRLIDERLRFTYSYQNEINLKMKRSVSDLKHENMVILEDGNGNFEKLEADGSKKANKGALYGTAMHRFMEIIDYEAYFKNPGAAEISRQMEYFHNNGRIDDDTYSLIDQKKILDFMENEKAAVLAEAYKKGKLFREYPFVMAIPAREAFKNTDEFKDSDEKVLVQGIIDLYYIEDDGITVIDYKTDAVSTDEALIERYKKQLYLYSEALAKGLGLAIKEILMYSFKMGKFVSVPMDF